MKPHINNYWFPDIDCNKHWICPQGATSFADKLFGGVRYIRSLVYSDTVMAMMTI